MIYGQQIRRLRKIQVMNNYLKIPDDFVLNLPPETKDEFGYTPSQNKEIEKQMVKDTSKSKGAWARFMKAQEEAERAAKSKLENLPILNRNINNRKLTGTRTGLSRGGLDTKVMPKKDKMLQYIDDHLIVYENKKASKEETDAAIKRLELRDKRIATEPTEENLYEIWLQMKKSGELPNMNFKEFEKNYRLLDIDLTKKIKKLPSKVDIDFDLAPMRTAYLGTRGLGDKIKNTSLYKLLDNPKVMGVELGEQGIMEVINLLQNSGLLKDGGKVK
jgi:hypothetical protein